MKDNLPNNWEWKKLSEVIQIERGGSPRPIENYITQSSDGLNWIKISDATASDKYIYKTKEKIKREGLHKSKMVYEGDFILSNSMSFGKPYIMKTTGCIHDGWLLLRDKQKVEIDKEFLYYLLTSPIVFKQFNILASGTTVRNLNISLVSSVKIALPPLEEQKHIVAILEKTFSKLDQSIVLVKQNIEKIKRLNESALSQVFEKLLNKKVSKKKLVDIADVKRGKSKHRPRNDKRLYDGDYPLIQTGDIRNAGKFITQFSQTYNEIGLAQSKLWEKGTVCLTIAANIGDVAILGIDACFPDSVVGIHSKTEDNIYIYYFLKSIKKQLDEKSSASAQKNLSVEKLSDFYIPIPSLAKQQQIVSHLDQLTEKNNKLLQHYQNKLEALQRLKNSVLETAFKGDFKKDNVLVLADPYIERNKQLSAKKNADKQAMVIALSIEAHNKLGKSLYRTKGEKTVELIEKHIGLEFGREAKKLAAGPASFQHLVKVVEPLAKTHKWFNVQEIKGDNFDSHKYIQGENFNPFLLRAVKELQSNLPEIRRVISLFANLKTTHEAEVYATTYAGWNNLIIRKLNPDDEAIVTEARENWHEAKLKIERNEFFDAIKWLRNNNLVPKGNGKEVN
jgi:type I restriction enzyme S subunit